MAAAETKADMTVERTLHTHRALAFDAWANEERVVEWFGPRAFPVVEWVHDFVPGGSFRYVMEGPDGQRLPGGGEYLEINDGERILSRSRVEVDGRVVFEVEQTVTFADAGEERTRVCVEGRVITNDGFAGAHGMEQGWIETLQRLDEHVVQGGEHRGRHDR